MRPWLILLTLIATIASAHAGKHDYFECTNAAGVVSFSMEKCAKGDAQKIIRDDQPPGATVTTAPPAALGGAKTVAAPAQADVILYATQWCGYCKKTRELFAEKRVRYTEFDIEKSDEGRKQHAKLGGGGVPVLNIRGKIIHGYGREEILAALNLK